MRIGITCYPTYGGSGVVATELGKGLLARGHEVHFIAYALPFRIETFSEGLYYHEVSVNTYPLFEYPPYSLALTSKMVDVVKFEGLDVLHVHYAIPHATSAILARQILAGQGMDIPVVTTLHGTDITIVGQDPSYAPVATYSIEQSDAVTAVSDYLRRETYEAFDVAKEIDVIPNFVDLDRFHRQDKEHFKRALCADDEYLITHVSNFRQVKRVDDVVRIFAHAVKAGVKARLLLVGDGPERGPVERLAREMDVFEKISFLGKQGPIEEILSISDLFLIPSESETFGLAALEAMSCGVPVISSDVGGLPELNIDGETGYVRPLGDIEALGNAVVSILGDDQLRETMRASATSRARDHFAAHQVIPRYEEVYSRVMSEPTLSHCPD